MVYIFSQSLSYFPLNLQHPLPVLWGAGQVLAAESQKKKVIETLQSAHPTEQLMHQKSV